MIDENNDEKNYPHSRPIRAHRCTHETYNNPTDDKEDGEVNPGASMSLNGMSVPIEALYCEMQSPVYHPNPCRTHTHKQPIPVVGNTVGIGVARPYIVRVVQRNGVYRQQAAVGKMSFAFFIRVI